MKKPAIPANEVERTAAVDALAMVHSPAEERFDRITRLACKLFDVPISLVSLISRDKQWFKSAQGLGVPGTPRDIAFCAHAINHDELLLVEDARVHPDFHDHPAVTGDPHVRFYAGQPIQYQGQLVGTLCLVNYEPGTLTLSVGVTAANAGPGVLTTKLVNTADQALYETKAAGRNGMTFRAFA